MTSRGKRRIASWGCNFQSQSKYSTTSRSITQGRVSHISVRSRRSFHHHVGSCQWPWVSHESCGSLRKGRKNTMQCSVAISRLANLFPLLPVSFDYNILRQYSYYFLDSDSNSRAGFRFQIQGVQKTLQGFSVASLSL